MGDGVSGALGMAVFSGGIRLMVGLGLAYALAGLIRLQAPG